MQKTNRIKEVIQTLKRNGKHITVDAVITESLFSPGDTLAGCEDEIKEVFWEIKENVRRQVNRQYMDQNIKGFVESVAINEYFNEPNTKNFLEKQQILFGQLK